MGNSPAYQNYPADWLTDTETLGWNMELMGCYYHLVNHLWLSGGHLKLSMSDLKTIWRQRTCRQAETKWHLISIKFDVKLIDGIEYITHKRINKEIQRQTEYRLMKSAAGKKGMESRYGKSNKDITAEKTDLNPSSSSSSSSSINNNNQLRDTVKNLRPNDQVVVFENSKYETAAQEVMLVFAHRCPEAIQPKIQKVYQTVEIWESWKITAAIKKCDQNTKSFEGVLFHLKEKPTREQARVQFQSNRKVSTSSG